MRIELYNPIGEVHVISSDNPEVVALWLRDLLPTIEDWARNASNPPWRLSVWPSGNWDSRRWPQQVPVTAKSLLWVIEGFEIMRMGAEPKVRIA